MSHVFHLKWFYQFQILELQFIRIASEVPCLSLICIFFINFQLQLLGCLAGVEMVLKDVGYPVKMGSGVGAASAYLQVNTPLIASRIWFTSSPCTQFSSIVYLRPTCKKCIICFPCLHFPDTCLVSFLIHCLCIILYLELI